MGKSFRDSRLEHNQFPRRRWNLMTYTRSTRSLPTALVCLFVFVFSGPTRLTAADPQFDKIVDDYFAARFDYRPSEGTAAGLHHFDHRLEDLSQARATKRIEELAQFKLRLTALKRASNRQQSRLPADDLIDGTFLEKQIDAELIDLQRLGELKRNPMVYAGLPGSAVDLLIKRDFAPPAERLRAVISREKEIPAVFWAARKNLVGPPRESTSHSKHCSKRGRLTSRKTTRRSSPRQSSSIPAKLRPKS
jgi:hypothetical protein